MISQKDILTALQNGEDPEVIAKTFTDALNGAIAEQKAAKAAEAKKKQEKLDSMECIICDIRDFIASYYPEVQEVVDIGPDKTADLIEIFDEFYAQLRPLVSDTTKTVADILGGLGQKPAKSNAKKDPITEFLQVNGLF